ncbi:MAG: SPOR domain-containing protein [Alphaproteobacteria bacterium]|nr:SPOR domain-containing protein [Alphaproteobacteria bacterium]
MFFAALVANAGSASAATSGAAATSEAAYAALNGGDAAKSVLLYTQAIESRELAPDALANAFLNRGLAYQNSGQHQQAVDDYSAALNLDAMPSELRARALFNRGLAQEKTGKPALAIEDFTSALLIDSSFSYAYLARANALRDNGQYLFSISDYERAVKYHHPDLARVYYGEAQAFEQLKRPVETKRLLQAALAANSAFAPAAEKLKSLGAVAELDDATSDPILTSSISASASGSTDVVKQGLPKGVEPPAALMATAINLQPPALNQDTPAPETTPVADAAPAAAKADTKVIVASVPSIPNETAPSKAAAKKPAAMAAAQVKKPAAPAEPAVDEIATGDTAPAADVPAASGWAVQISSAASEDAAWASWKALQKQHQVLASVKPVVVKAELGAKGTFYRVRLQGFEDQSSAQSACGKLKSGGVSCYIAKAAG